MAERKGPKPLSALLEEARLELLPAGVPSYLRAAQPPPRNATRRKFCSVCGFQAPCVPRGASRPPLARGALRAASIHPFGDWRLATDACARALLSAAFGVVFCRYTCPRCGMRFCSRKCSGTHAETRCLRFTV